MATTEKKLARIPKDGMLAGVAAGFARYFEIDITLMRLIFVAIILATGGTAIVAYIVMAIVMPADTDPAGKVGTDVGDKIESLAREVKANGQGRRAANFIGIGLIAFGAWLLVGQLFPTWFRLQWDIIWPGLIVVLGIWIIARSKTS